MGMGTTELTGALAAAALGSACVHPARLRTDKVGRDDVACPGLAVGLGQLFEDAQVLHGLDVAGDDANDLPDLLAVGGVRGQERALGPRLVQVLEDAHGLPEREAVDDQRRHHHRRVQLRVRLGALCGQARKEGWDSGGHG